MAEERTLTLAARYENVPVAAKFVVEAAEHMGFDEQAIFHCQMAADEACTNIIEHAYGNNEDKGTFKLILHLEKDRLVITLLDRGRPFDPASVPEPVIDSDPSKMKPGGLGIHLMKQLMDEVTFSFEDNGNKLVMVKKK